MTRRAAAVAAFALLMALPLHADFASIARAIDAKDGVSRIWIPFLGIARTFVRIVEPHGVNDFQLVTFRGAERIDSREMQSLIAQKVGPGFRPLVRAYSRKTGEWSFIYARPVDRESHVELIILARDDEETVLVRVDVDADTLARQIAETGNVKMVARR